MRFPYHSHIAIWERYGSHIGVLLRKFRDFSGKGIILVLTHNFEMRRPEKARLPVFTICCCGYIVDGNKKWKELAI